jgi:hypothetical protein
MREPAVGPGSAPRDIAALVTLRCARPHRRGQDLRALLIKWRRPSPGISNCR